MCAIHLRRTFSALALSCFVLTCLAAPSAADPPGEPVNGMRPAALRVHAITGVTVVPRPGERIENATIVLRDGVIEAIGTDIPVPPEAAVVNGAGLTAYAGLIDAGVLAARQELPASPGMHWCAQVRAEGTVDVLSALAEVAEPLRSQGFAIAAIHPDRGILRGRGVVTTLAETDAPIYSTSDAFQGAGFDRGGGYPGSKMGSIAVLRQTLLDAAWHARSRTVYRRHPEGNEPPAPADSLVALAPVVAGKEALLFDATNELDAMRAAAVTTEMGVDLVVLGCGTEFRRLDEITALGVPFILPVKWPDAPKIESPADAERVSLRDLMTWEQAPTNPRRLVDAGTTVALTTQRLSDRGDFRARVADAIRHGLSPDDALAAVTTTPAALLGMDDVLGELSPGRAAHVVLVEGDLFDPEAPIRAVYIDGQRHDVDPSEPDRPRFAGALDQVEMEVDLAKPTARFRIADAEDWIDAAAVKRAGDGISATFDASVFGSEGYAQLDGTASGDALLGSVLLPDGRRRSYVLALDESSADDDDAEERPGRDRSDDDAFEMPPDALNVPLGAYGLAEVPQAEDVLIVNATIWTSGNRGIVESGAMLVEGGRITGVYDTAPEVASGTTVIDLDGAHVTPGLIDCHSHTGISQGVNEFGQTNTAEVRIGDVINPDDVNWYRQLAGGTTAVNQLHGSANPIGGQNSVVKIRWGGGARDFPVAGAIGGIKFALGENVIRSEERYPNTRMGVESFFRDAFTAAREYQAEHDRWKKQQRRARRNSMAPRRDLELETLVEILEGERLVHCHSYRQDEILMLIRVADDFGFTIGTFQHVLEGFKVADAIAEHGAGASSFSDWWAYKVEVMDAIPFNGALMTDVGVNVSFNSDSSELARRLNTEATKAVRYGGLEPHEALKMVTINPAWQLRVHDRIGSLEAGKDADFVVWSGDPLSTYSRCEQTWVDGAKRFSRDDDLVHRAWAQQERNRLVQRVLAAKHGATTGAEEAHDEEDGDEHGHAADAGAPAYDAATRAWMEEQVRLGADPFEIRAGDCGCSAVHAHEHH